MSYSIFVEIDNQYNIEAITEQFQTIINDYFAELGREDDFYIGYEKHFILVTANDIAYLGDYIFKSTIGFNLNLSDGDLNPFTYNLLIQIALRYGVRDNVQTQPCPSIIYDGSEKTYIVSEKHINADLTYSSYFVVDEDDYYFSGALTKQYDQTPFLLKAFYLLSGYKRFKLKREEFMNSLTKSFFKTHDLLQKTDKASS